MFFALHHVVYRCLPLFTVSHRLCCQPGRVLRDLIRLDKLVYAFILSNYIMRSEPHLNLPVLRSDISLDEYHSGWLNRVS